MYLLETLIFLDFQSAFTTWPKLLVFKVRYLTLLLLLMLLLWSPAKFWLPTVAPAADRLFFKHISTTKFDLTSFTVLLKLKLKILKRLAKKSSRQKKSSNDLNQL